jgi:hypothetical protein
MAAETRSGQAPRLIDLAAFVSRNLPPFSSIYSSPPTPTTNSANAPPVAAAPSHPARRFVSLLRPPRLRPTPAFLASAVCHRFGLLTYTVRHDWLTTVQSTGLASMMTPTCQAASSGGASPCGREAAWDRRSTTSPRDHRPLFSPIRAVELWLPPPFSFRPSFLPSFV